MDDDFLPDEFVLDDAPEEQSPPKVIFAGPSDPPPVFRMSPSTAQRSRRGPPYAVVALCLGTGAALTVVVVEATHPRVLPVERTAVSITKVEPPAPSTSAEPATMASAEVDAAA